MKRIRLLISVGMLVLTCGVGFYFSPTAAADETAECNCIDGWTKRPGLIYIDQGEHCRPDGCYVICEVE